MSANRLQEKSRELADLLRGVAEDLTQTDIGEDDIAEAVELTQRLRVQLKGPRRQRWYEGRTGASPLGQEGRNEYLNHSPVRGVLNPIAPPLEVETVTRADGGQAIEGRVRLGVAYEGPPNGVHGGWIAALFDELLGVTQMLEGVVGVTAILEIKYRSITPIDEELRLTGWVAKRRGGRFVAKATCHAGDRLTAEAKGIFVTVDFDELRERKAEK